MCLVVVAAAERDIRPIHILFRRKILDHLLKALHTRIQLRREPHLLTENVYEPPAADSNLIGQLRHRRALRPQPNQRIVDGAMPLHWPVQLLQKKLLEPLQLGFRRGLLQQALSQADRRSSP